MQRFGGVAHQRYMSKFLWLECDRHVIHLAQQGDRTAMAQVYRQFAPPVFELALRLTQDAGLAAELAQDAFVDVLSQIGSFRGDGSFAGWLRRIVVNRCLMQLRRRREYPLWSGESADEAVAAADATDAIDLAQALASLSMAARAVLWLHVVEGFSHAEIGVMCGRSESYSKSQLARALIRLRRWYQIDEKSLA